MSSYPVHRSLPPSRRYCSDENLLPGEVWNKPLNPHANLSLLRAARIACRSLVALVLWSVSIYSRRDSISGSSRTVHPPGIFSFSQRREDGFFMSGKVTKEMADLARRVASRMLHKHPTSDNADRPECA
jgi:hypothetical protein